MNAKISHTDLKYSAWQVPYYPYVADIYVFIYSPKLLKLYELKKVS